MDYTKTWSYYYHHKLTYHNKNIFPFTTWLIREWYKFRTMNISFTTSYHSNQYAPVLTGLPKVFLDQAHRTTPSVTPELWGHQCSQSLVCSGICFDTLYWSSSIHGHAPDAHTPLSLETAHFAEIAVYRLGITFPQRWELVVEDRGPPLTGTLAC